MTTVYLAYGAGGHDTLARHSHKSPVDLLVAFPFLKDYEKRSSAYTVNKWCLDSGAFSAWNSGKEVDLNEYIAACRALEGEVEEVFGLDVIMDPEGTRRNLETMWDAGVPAIPTFHQGSAWKWLEWAATNTPNGKIAISGKKRGKWQFVEQCFARVWPIKIHGFAMASPKSIEVAPFHSVDAVSWCFSPSAMGNWAGYTGSQMRVGTRKATDYWIEVVEHQRRARWGAFIWRNELGLLAEPARADSPSQ